jgi:eukaryotic-like serine/threonine-protein kinase
VILCRRALAGNVAARRVTLCAKALRASKRYSWLSMFRYIRIAAGAFAMFVVMVIAAGITLRLALHAGEVTIPNFSGLTVQEASDAALHAGLDLNINNKFFSTTVPAGRILSQAPAPGSEVRKGWQVRVTESLGPQQVTIPDVVGEPVREATMDLRRNQLDLGTEAHLDAPGDPDLVLAQTPPPNAGVDQPRVNLLLSSQSQDAANAFVMPSFVGDSYSTANHEAIALGLRVATIGGIPATPPPAPLTPEAQGAVSPLGAAPAVAPPPAPVTPVGPVLSQSPEAGHRASRGQTIRLYFTRPSVSSTTPASTTTSVTTVPTGPVQ